MGDKAGGTGGGGTPSWWEGGAPPSTGDPTLQQGWTQGFTAPQTQEMVRRIQGNPTADAWLRAQPGFMERMGGGVGEQLYQRGITSPQFRMLTNSLGWDVSPPQSVSPPPYAAPLTPAPDQSPGPPVADPYAAYTAALQANPQYVAITTHPGYLTAFTQGVSVQETQRLLQMIHDIPGADAYFRKLPGWSDAHLAYVYNNGMTGADFNNFMRAIRYAITGVDDPTKFGLGGEDPFIETPPDDGTPDELPRDDLMPDDLPPDDGTPTGPPGETLTGLGPMMDALRAIEFYNERFGPQGWQKLLEGARPEIRSRLLGARRLQIPNLPYIPMPEDVGFSYGPP